MKIVLDASAAIPMIAPQLGLPLAEPIDAADELFAPELFCVETLNVLWKYAQAGMLAWPGAFAAAERLESLPVAYTSDVVLAHGALRLSRELAHPVYDCLYLALALDLDAQVLTRDRRFAAAAESAYPGRVRALG